MKASRRGWSAASLVVGLLLAALAAHASSRKLSQALLPSSIDAGLDAGLFFIQFKAALETAGLLDILASEDFNGTVFAPTDWGFSQYFAERNTTLEQFADNKERLANMLKFHIVPDVRLFPLTVLRQGLKIPTLLKGASLTVDRSTPGIIHIWGGPKELAPGQPSTNFGTIMQFQEIRGAKSILYVLDKPLTPPATPAPPATSTKAPTTKARKP